MIVESKPCVFIALFHAVLCRLVAREDAGNNICIVGLSEKQCSNTDELLNLIAQGNNMRSTGTFAQSLAQSLIIRDVMTLRPNWS